MAALFQESVSVTHARAILKSLKECIADITCGVDEQIALKVAAVTDFDTTTSRGVLIEWVRRILGDYIERVAKQDWRGLVKQFGSGPLDLLLVPSLTVVYNKAFIQKLRRYRTNIIYQASLNESFQLHSGLQIPQPTVDDPWATSIGFRDNPRAAAVAAATGFGGAGFGSSSNKPGPDPDSDAPDLAHFQSVLLASVPVPVPAPPTASPAVLPNP